jgi:hypothetical protein
VIIRTADARGPRSPSGTARAQYGGVVPASGVCAGQAVPDHWKHTWVESQQLRPLFTGAHQFWQSWSVAHCCEQAAVLPASGVPELPELLPELLPDEPELLPVVDASDSPVP